MKVTEAKVLETPARVSVERVLIAMDFSVISERALRHGLAIARRYGASVDIAHIVGPLGDRLTREDDVIVRAVDRAQQDMQRMEAALREGKALKDMAHRMLVETESGEVWEALCRLIRKNNIDLVVLGTHGRTGFQKLCLGSVAEGVFRHSPCPVLTVGPGVDPEIIGDGPPQHILFPTDLSRESIQALPFAVSAARKCGADLTLLHVVREFTGEALVDRERMIEAIRGQLEILLLDAGLPRSPNYLVKLGSPPAVIMEVSRDHQIDLIILGLHSPEVRADRLIWQYVYEIVCLARCPVVTLRSAPAE